LHDLKAVSGEQKLHKGIQLKQYKLLNAQMYSHNNLTPEMLYRPGSKVHLPGSKSG